MEEVFEKGDLLVEVIPYVKRIAGEIVVIKYGGNAMLDEIQKDNVIKQIILLKMLGIKVVLVHGGGPDIEEELKNKKIESIFKNGLRVTDKETMEVVKVILIGKTNTEIVKMLNMQSGNAIGLSGIDANIIKCKKSTKDIGYVGEIKNINSKLILDLLENDYIPVISPIGTDENGDFYNINADTVASEVAISLKCKKIILLTNIDGLMDEKKELISVIKKEDINKLISKNVIVGGMIPKVQACINCLNNGVEKAHILNGAKKNTILCELLTDKGIGTMIV